MTDRVCSKLGILLVISSLGLATLVACSSSDTTGGSSSGKSSSGGGDDDDDDTGTSSSSSSSGGGSLETTAYTKELCARMERCAPGQVTARWGTQAACVTANDKDIAPLRALASTGMTDAALSACAAKLKTADCKIFDEREIEECNFKGKAANGTACSAGLECTSGSCFYASESADCGKCTAAAALGADCSAAECEPGAYCADGTKKCTAPAALGAACTNAPCANGLACIAKKCAEPLAEGATCTEPTGPDDQDPCVPGTFCVGTCKAFPVTGKPGESCDDVDCINGSCGEDGKCLANLAEGAACNEQSGAFCQSPMECLSGKCQFATIDECK